MKRIIILFFCLLLLWLVLSEIHFLHEKKEEIKAELAYCFEEKYTEEMQIDHVSIGDHSVLAHPVSSPDLVFYAVYNPEFSPILYDNYLEKSLSAEVESMVQEMLRNHGIFNCKVSASSLNIPPADRCEKLYRKYLELGRPPKLNEIADDMKFEWISVVFPEKEVSEEKLNDIKKIFDHCEIPVESIDISGKNYNTLFTFSVL